RTAKKTAIPDADLIELAEIARKDAPQYGQAWLSTTNAAVATALLKHPGVAADAMKYAELGEKGLSATDPPARRIKVLEAVMLAAQAAGAQDAGKRAAAEVAKLDSVLDKEYVARGLPFKPAAFDGRKTDSK